MKGSFLRRLKQVVLVLRNGDAAEKGNIRTIPLITTEEIEEIRRFFPRPKFFIFGHARSGTTLLARLIRVHPEVHCNWQAHFFTRPPFLTALVQDQAIGEWLGRRSNRWNNGRDLSPVVLRVTADFILEREAMRLGKSIVGDKSPNSLVNGEAVRRAYAIYPDASLIYILRDGRDTILSHRFQTFIDSPQHLSAQDLQLRDEFIRQPQPFLQGEKSIFTPKGFLRAVEEWVENVETTVALGRELFGDRFLIVRYEDLLAKVWEEMQKVWRFLGVSSIEPDLEPALQAERQENPDAEWQNQKAAQIAQLLRKGQSGSWRELFTPQEKALFLEKARATLQAWGYPTDADR
jgi:hypothetical protein